MFINSVFINVYILYNFLLQCTYIVCLLYCLIGVEQSEEYRARSASGNCLRNDTGLGRVLYTNGDTNIKNAMNDMVA